METIYLGPRTYIQPDEVTHLQADVNYTIVYSRKNGRRIISCTLKKVMEMLEENGSFLRISRKHAINMNFVVYSDYHSYRLTNGLELKPSRRRKRRIIRMDKNQNQDI
ncbi:LytTR family transcriptional regulator [Marinilongibacter aquaticus]|uniref:LytTR family DNA-binding domain-containing protein n=1 Tax=Marinilongibacter aquaticus TaxID=2975157 RepID=UPI0021BD9FF8|nr:LytTR family DNA-binding domain-containing protein [Marinilongibacter aquaticus]UBM60351.1 LytTR family transcriptional regulator [Marinilongibacter aquaticus]